MVPENWKVVERGNDSQGQWVHIDRNQGHRTTSWRLYQVQGEWRVFRISFSQENRGLNGVSEREKDYTGDACPCHRKGIRLSANRIDRILRDMAEGRYETR